MSLNEKMENLKQEISKLKTEKNAVILAHYYQNPEIQEIADYVGDSYYLSEVGRDLDADVIIYCGVQFMAESAKILSPDKTVLFPAYTDAPCCMEYMATPEKVNALKEQHPDAKVVCYINSSSAVKAVSDACCTSASAEKIVRNIDANKIIFVPDKNLGSYVQEKINDKDIILFDGCCNIHDKVKSQDISDALEKHGKLEVVAHPECVKEVRDMADFVGSTSGILKYIKASDKKKFLVVTEKGIAYEIDKENPDKEFVYLNMICNPMKKIFLETVVESLNDFNKYEVNVSVKIIEGAKKALENMHYYAEKGE